MSDVVQTQEMQDQDVPVRRCCRRRGVVVSKQSAEVPSDVRIHSLRILSDKSELKHSKTKEDSPTNRNKERRHPFRPLEPRVREQPQPSVIACKNDLSSPILLVVLPNCELANPTIDVLEYGRVRVLRDVGDRVEKRGVAARREHF